MTTVCIVCNGNKTQTVVEVIEEDGKLDDIINFQYPFPVSMLRY